MNYLIALPIINIIALYGVLASLPLRTVPTLYLYIILFSVIMIIAYLWFMIFNPASLFYPLYLVGSSAFFTIAAASLFYCYKSKNAENIVHAEQVPVKAPVKAPVTMKNKYK